MVIRVVCGVKMVDIYSVDWSCVWCEDAEHM